MKPKLLHAYITQCLLMPHQQAAKIETPDETKKT